MRKSQRSSKLGIPYSPEAVGPYACPSTALRFAPLHVLLTQGSEFADHQAARVEAAKRIGALLNDHAGRVWVDQEWQMNITDDAGLIPYVVQINTMRPAAEQSVSPADDHLGSVAPRAPTIASG